ncbi:D-alanyl-D-alanine carboxypeptidase/D-alanyl-D-alanine endopeptidase [Aeromicrobium yanjiei]|uniref:D-alanyl-D-alanine carboxypeptidase/D-alanyl-D-alanine-endopeptidase n=1 Tax=Aeromicrobium yanjiei TaxID=2662028 RepID=A0A5Q2MQU6_9ACTN|nr:D-alanyl-D-alanine carboxypeptidase/D-alanyl-D-alanine-endopeptidase [Aeromicrobium yanjiei]QGG42770.1 D-alanyl-D-alanine carboxypeptidase/D-alanyl-D-alanine-endopeptidase [Aeromicrobium yanjiei]
MARRQDIRVTRTLLSLALPLVVIAAVVLGGTALWERGDLNRFICDGDCGPSNVIAPRSLAIDATPGIPGRSGSTKDPGPVDPAKLAAAVAPTLKAKVLGPHVGLAALSPDDGSVLAGSGSGTFVPASTTKVLTGYAALATIEPGTRFTTRVVRSGDRLVLVGGGDPYLATRPAADGDRVHRGDLTTLARRAAAALEEAGVSRVSLDYDASLFTGPAASPAWRPSYVAENLVTPVSSLWADQGVENGLRADDPARAAARTFASLLRKRGIEVSGNPAPATVPEGARQIATVRSATIGQIVETLIRTSDNQAAEVVLRQVAVAAGEPATFDGGARAVREALEAADVDVSGLRLTDGSGLSRSNRIAPMTLAETLRAAGTSSRTSGLLADLPVSGFTGTLVNRFAQLPTALGTVRAKTGTLTGVHSLAGYALDADGRPVIFAVMADRTDRDQPFAAQAAVDKVAAAIASCRCGRQ